VKNSKAAVAPQASGEVVVEVASGLSTEPARQIIGHVRQFQCTATLANERGETVDARNLFELLTLGVSTGESVTINCVGSDAHAAYAVIARILADDPDTQVTTNPPPRAG
jgi:phosphotransferase system HPr (HPr) family protein